MKSFLVITSIFFSFCIQSCHKSDGIVSPIASGVYQYKAFDNNNILITAGTIHLAFEDSSKITGDWKLFAIENPRNIGPQFGTGNLTGSIKNGEISINLNPNFVDNNVILHGKFSVELFSGKWEWIGFPGVINSGTFKSELKPVLW